MAPHRGSLASQCLLIVSILQIALGAPEQLVQRQNECVQDVCTSSDSQGAPAEASQREEAGLMQLPRANLVEALQAAQDFPQVALSGQEEEKVDRANPQVPPQTCCEAVEQGLRAYLESQRKLSAVRSRLASFCKTQDPSQAISAFDELPDTVSKHLASIADGAVGDMVGTSVPDSCDPPALPEHSILPLCSARPQSSFLGSVLTASLPSFTNETRALQATLATTLFSMASFVLEECSLIDRIAAIYHVYRQLSSNGGGGYYPDTEYGMVIDLPRHILDLGLRLGCSLNSNCAYSRGRRDEYARHAFRMINALEMSIVSACADPQSLCVPGLMPVFGFQPSWFKWDKEVALKAVWASHYVFNAVEVGEAMWQINATTCIAAGVPHKWAESSY